MTFRHKHTAALASAVLLTQSVCGGLPVSRLHAADTVRSASDFAELIASASHQPEEVFETLRYDARTDQLYQDGKPVGKSYAGFTVSNGTVCADGVPVSANQTSGYEVQENADGSIELRSPFQSARLIVRSTESVDPMGGTVTAEGYHDLHVIQYNSTADAYAAYCAYQQDSRITYAVPDRYYCADLSVIPEAESVESDNTKSWGYHAIGSEEYLSWLKSSSKELPEITAAVLDTGIYAEHSWFEGRIAENGLDCTEGEIPLRDVYGHGTHCSGIICQNTPEQVKILPIKVISDRGTGSDLMLYCGLMHAIEQKADVISMSLGGDGDSPLVREALQKAVAADIPCCVSTGNDSFQGDYANPGSMDEAFSISATYLDIDTTDPSFLDYSDPDLYSLALFSNIGPFVDFAAPGYEIISAAISGPEDVTSMSGTSMAAPFATAACCDVLSANPEMTVDEIHKLLSDSAMQLNPPQHMDNVTAADCYGAGMINLRGLIEQKVHIHAPSITVNGGEYKYNTWQAEDSVTVSIRTEIPDTEIRYTTDGSEPNAENSTLYQNPFTVSESAIIRAAAFVNGESGQAESVYICIGEKDIADPYTVKDGVLTEYRGVLNKLDLTSEFPDGSLLAVGDRVFQNNNRLFSVILPDSVTKLGAYAFAQCSVYYLRADGVTELSDYTFANSDISNLNLSSTLTKIGAGTFCECHDLTWLPNLGETITEIPDHAFEGCRGLSMYEGNFDNVRRIGKYAFARSGLGGVVDFPKLEELEPFAFSECLIEEISMSSSVTVLPESVFNESYSLKRIIAPGVTVIKRNAMMNCKPESADFLANVTEIGIDAIFTCEFQKDAQSDERYFSFNGLKEAPIESVKFNSANCPLVFPNIKALEPDTIYANEALIWLPNAESIVQNEDNNRCIRVSETLKSAEFRTRSAAGYIIGPAYSPARTAAEKAEIPYFETKKLYAEKLNIDTATMQECMFYCEYVADPDISLKWYRIVDGNEQEVDPDIITNSGAYCDVNASSLTDYYYETGTFYFRAVLFEGEKRIDSKDFTLTVTEGSLDTPPQARDNPLNYGLTDNSRGNPTQVYRPGDVVMFDSSIFQYSFYIEKECAVRLHAVNRNVHLSAALYSMSYGAGYLSDMETTELYPGFYSLRKLKGTNQDVFKMPLLFSLEKVKDAIDKTEALSCDAIFTGQPIKPAFRITMDEKELTEGTDYEICCDEELIQPGQYHICIKGIGAFYGEIWRTFCILPKETTTGSAYTGGDCTVLPDSSGQPVVLTWKPEKDRYCLYKTSLPIATVSIMAADGSVAGSVSGLYDQYSVLEVKPGEEYRIAVTNYYPQEPTAVTFSLIDDFCLLAEDVEAEITELVMQGEKPQITLKAGETPLTEGEDYIVFCKSTEKYIGKAGLTVRGLGKYVGELDLYYWYAPIDPEQTPNVPVDGNPKPITLQLNVPSEFDDTIIPYPGLAENYLFTVPEDGSYTMTLPDIDENDVTILLYVNQDIPKLIQETQYTTDLKKNDSIRILLIRNYLRAFPIIDVIKPYFILITNEEEAKVLEADGISYRIQNGTATVFELNDTDCALYIPDTVTDPETGEKIPVTAIDETVFVPMARNITIITEKDSTIAKICKESDYNYIILNSDSKQKGDINGDGIADFHDVLILQQYLTEFDGMAPDRLLLGNADLNADEMIGFDDLRLLLKLLEQPQPAFDLYAVYRRVTGDLDY